MAATHIMKIASIVGARPEFVQAAAVSRAIRVRHEELLIHTGQHYDQLMSEVFFRDLALPQPDVNLGIGSAPASIQLAQIVSKISSVLCEAEPDIVIVRGDTNSTLGAALAARQNGFPIAHIEAGMRSGDRKMPEETNRIVTDHLSDWLFATDAGAAANLKNENVSGEINIVGDVMYDTYQFVKGTLSSHRPEVRFPPKFHLLTVHRQENTESCDRLARIISSFKFAKHPVLFPAHPRTKKRIFEWNIPLPPQVVIVEPLSYLDMLAAEMEAEVIFTDSGGVQREAYFSHRPCITLRETTEWGNTLETGWNHLVGSSDILLKEALQSGPSVPQNHPDIFGDGAAAGKIVSILESPTAAEIVRSWGDHRRQMLNQ